VDKEDAAYGTAFIDGNATIKGLTGLFIRVVAQSEKGPVKIPINYAESVSDNSLFILTAKEKYNIQNGS
jgi:hypothetical protein